MSALDPTALRFLRRSMIARIATLSKSGRPQIMPLWFFLDNGDILMSNSATSAAVRSIAHHPEVELLFLADKDPTDRRCLRIRGNATFEPTTSRFPMQALLRGAPKYYFAPQAVLLAARNIGRIPSFLRYGRERSGHVGFIRVTPTSCDYLPTP